MIRGRRRDLLVIGGGPAGLAAAIKGRELGLDVLLLENREILGGIPLQCVHPGFGLHYFGEDLTGTEFIQRFVDKFERMGIECVLGGHLSSMSLVSDLEKEVKVITSRGILSLRATAVVYATGARERHLHEIGVAGSRAPGVFTAGEAQTMMDIYGIMPGREVVIVGSGDVGLIMARRFALEGASVRAVVELMPYPGGLTRNVAQCLEDFGIPLYLSHSVVAVEGGKRVERVRIARVGEDLKPLPGTEREIGCDTLVVAAGLVPYIKVLEGLGVIRDESTRGPVVNDLLETSVPGVFVAGNAMAINDLVDHVVEQGERAALGAFEFASRGGISTRRWRVLAKGANVRILVPHMVSGEEDVTVYARVSRPLGRARVVFPEIGKELRLPVARPAEMISVRLRREEIDRAGDRITMEVLEDGRG